MSYYSNGKPISDIFNQGTGNGAITTNIRVNNVDICNNYLKFGTRSNLKAITTNYLVNGNDLCNILEMNLIDTTQTTATISYTPVNSGCIISITGNGNLYFKYPIDSAQFLIIGGGGGGGGSTQSNAGGGGGAGCVGIGTNGSSLIRGLINISIGTGGAGGVGGSASGTSGSSTSFIFDGSIVNTITVPGGGAGGSGKSSGLNGGSGGGGGSFSTNTTGGGKTTKPLNTSLFTFYGNDGGIGDDDNNDEGRGGGGGGASYPGEPGETSNGNGGNGIGWNPVYGYIFNVGGGGGGGRAKNSAVSGAGGSGGGGNGGYSGFPATIGTDGLGGGGGGAWNESGSGARGGNGAIYICILQQNVLLDQGLKFNIYSGYFADSPTWFQTATPLYINGVTTGYTKEISSITTGTNGLIPANTRNSYSVEWYGLFFANATGIWTFFTNSDDGSFLWIGNSAVSGYTTTNALVDNSGGHPMTEKSGTISLTTNTYYPIRIQFGESADGDNMIVSFTPPGGSKITNGTANYFYNVPDYLQPQNIGFAGSARLLVPGYTGPILRVLDPISTNETDLYTDEKQSYLSTGPNNTGISYATWLQQQADGGTIYTSYIKILYNQNGSTNHAIRLDESDLIFGGTVDYPFFQLLGNGKYVIQFFTSGSYYCAFKLTNIVYANTVLIQYNSSINTYYLLRYKDFFTYPYFLYINSGNVNGSSSNTDWYFSSNIQKISYVNGVPSTTVGVSTWNSLGLSVTTPPIPPGFYFIGLDGSFYMTDIILNNKPVSAFDLVHFYNRRLI